MQLYQILIPVIWTILMFGCVLYVKSNKKFQCIYFDENVKVNASPSLTWANTPKRGVIIGYALTALMWVGFFLIVTDTVIIGGENSTASNLVMFIPMVGAVISFFSGYSSRLVNNYESVPRSTFDSWLKLGYIEKAGGQDYESVDHWDYLERLFKNHNWII